MQAKEAWVGEVADEAGVARQGNAVQQGRALFRGKSISSHGAWQGGVNRSMANAKLISSHQWRASRKRRAIQPAVSALLLAALFLVAVGRAEAAPLPDARAYEQATPVDKNGNNIQGTPTVVQAAAVGARITYYVGGGIPGTQSTTDLPTYMSSRTPEGWESIGLLPPTSTGGRGYVAGWSSDLLHVYSTNFKLDGPLDVHAFGLDVQTGALSPFLEQLASAQVSLVGNSTDGQIVATEEPYAENSLRVTNRSSGESVVGSVLNDGSPLVGAVAGPYNWNESEASPSGGSNGHFYTAPTNALSADGETLYFSEPEETNQLYVRLNLFAPQSPVDGEGRCTDPTGACTIKVSASQATTIDPNGERPAAFVGATPDGASALFLSSGKLTDDATTGPNDEGRDLFRFNPVTEHLQDLTVDPQDANGAEVIGVLGYGADMSDIYFVANGVLANGATQGNCSLGGTPAEPRRCDLYVWHDGEIRFIGPMQTAGEPQREAEDQINWSPASHLFSGPPHSGEVTAAGETVLFSSVLNQTAFDSHGKAELYLYSAASGQTVCVSCNANGHVPAGNASINAMVPFEFSPKPPAATYLRNLSGDGGRVIFDTPDRLLPTDTNNANDVYEWEAPGKGSCQTATRAGGCLFLVSPGDTADPSFFADADEDGSDIFFFTAQSLVRQDQDELVDIYDARVGGGLASQNAAPATPCTNEDQCRPLSPGLAPTAAPGTSTHVGPPNAQQRPKHRHRRSKHHKHRRHKRGHKQKNTTSMAGGH